VRDDSRKLGEREVHCSSETRITVGWGSSEVFS
jgi:hypothetical protein